MATSPSLILLSSMLLFAAPPEADMDAIVESIDTHRLELNTNRHDAGVKGLSEDRDALEKMLADDKDNAAVLYQLGRTEFYLEENEKAVAHLTRAAELKPTDAQYAFFAGVACRFSERLNEAQKHFEAAAKLDPKRADVWYELGMIFAAQEKLPEALQAFDKSLALAPKDAVTLGASAAVLIMQGRIDVAFERLEKASSLSDDPDFAYNAGQLAQLLGRPEDAFKYFQRYRELAPDDAHGLEKVVQSAQAVGDTKARDQARERLYALHKKGAIKDDHFCREQFTIAKNHVFVYEYFELEGDRPTRYSFRVLDDDVNELRYSVTLGSYELTNSVAKMSGTIANNERLFHLDRYWPNEKHELFASYRNEPDYERVRADVVDVIEGKSESISSMTPTEDGGTKIEISEP